MSSLWLSLHDAWILLWSPNFLLHLKSMIISKFISNVGSNYIIDYHWWPGDWALLWFGIALVWKYSSWALARLGIGLAEHFFGWESEIWLGIRNLAGHQKSGWASEIWLGIRNLVGHCFGWASEIWLGITSVGHSISGWALLRLGIKNLVWHQKSGWALQI